MTTRALGAVAAAAVAALAACGSDTCPTAAAYPQAGQTPVCSEPAAQQISISLNMCEACSHTSPTCTEQQSDATTIFLDTRWQVCTDNSSCAAQACGTATCQFSVPNGTYTVHVLSASGTSTFMLDVAANNTATCTGTI